MIAAFFYGSYMNIQEVNQMQESTIIYAQWNEERRRWWIDCCPMENYPLPEGAEIITRVEMEDVRMLKSELEIMAKKRMTLRRMRAWCDGHA